MKIVSKIKKKYILLPKQLKASFWFLICSVLQRGITVITTPIFTRLMATEDYGQYGVFNAWLDIVSIFVTLRLYYGVFVQGLVKFSDDKARYASSMQGLALLLSTFWTIVYLSFHEYWNKLLGLTTTQMLAMMVMIWAAGAFRYWAAEQRNDYKYRHLVFITLIISVLKPVVGIFFVIHSDDKATARILGLAIVELAGYSFSFFVQMRRGRQFYSAKYWKHALLFNLPLIPHYLSQTVLNTADRIMIRDMIGPSEAGIYSLAYSISKIMSMFNQALTQTLSPWMYQKIKADRAKDIERIAYPCLIGIGLVNLLLIALAPEIVKLFAPKTYHNAVWIIPPVAMSLYFMFGYHLFACFEFYYEKTGFIMISSLISALMNILLNYIFIQIFGYYAAGYTTLICYMIYAIGHFWFMRKVCRDYLNNIRIYSIETLASITGAFLLLGFAFLLSYLNDIVRYSLILILLVILICIRKKIIDMVYTIISIRNQKKPVRQNTE